MNTKALVTMTASIIAANVVLVADWTVEEDTRLSADSAFHGAYYTIFDTIIVTQNDTATYCAGSGKMLIYAQPNRRKRQ